MMPRRKLKRDERSSASGCRSSTTRSEITGFAEDRDGARCKAACTTPPKWRSALRPRPKAVSRAGARKPRAFLRPRDRTASTESAAGAVGGNRRQSHGGVCCGSVRFQVTLLLNAKNARSIDALCAPTSNTSGLLPSSTSRDGVDASICRTTACRIRKCQPPHSCSGTSGAATYGRHARRDAPVRVNVAGESNHDGAKRRKARSRSDASGA